MYVFGPPVDAALAAGPEDIAELGRDYDSISIRLEYSTDQFFLAMVPVDVRGIEEVDAEFDRPIESCDRLGFIGNSIGLRHAHAPESHGRYHQSLTSEFAFFHDGYPTATPAKWKPSGVPTIVDAVSKKV